MATVAVCEDDAALRSVLRRALAGAGHRTVVAHDGAEAVRRFPDADPDLVVLDIGLPDADGRDVCLALRAAGVGVPVLFLTARSGLHDKVSGFASGGDDYLTKPFDLPELLARVNALTRRRPLTPDPGPAFELDPARHAAALAGRHVALSPTEFRVLARLLEVPGEVVRRSALAAAGWPMGAVVQDNTLDTYIRRLRGKLTELGPAAGRIRTVRAVGYAWQPPG